MYRICPEPEQVKWKYGAVNPHPIYERRMALLINELFLLQHDKYFFSSTRKSCNIYIIWNEFKSSFF